MRTASEADAFNSRDSAPCHRVRVIEFEEAARTAPDTGFTDECALVSVTLPDGAADLRGDMAGSAALRASLSSPGTRARFPLLDLADQSFQSTIEHLGNIAIWYGMAEQLLCVAEFLLGRLRERDLKQKDGLCLSMIGTRVTLNMPRGMLIVLI